MHAKNPSRRRVPPNASCRTMVDVPTSRIDHEKRTVGALQHVRRMEIRIRGPNEIFVRGTKRRVEAFEPMADNLARVELRGEEVATHVCGKCPTAISLQPAQSDCGIKSQGGQGITGDRLGRA